MIMCEGIEKKEGKYMQEEDTSGQESGILHMRELLRKTLKGIFGIQEVSCDKVHPETLR